MDKKSKARAESDDASKHHEQAIVAAVMPRLGDRAKEIQVSWATDGKMMISCDDEALKSRFHELYREEAKDPRNKAR